MNETTIRRCALERAALKVDVWGKNMAEKSCFVVGPIGAAGSDLRNHADLLLEFIIKPVMGDFPDYEIKRQDKDSKPGMIDSQIIIALRDADLVIADLSFVNPNAFYEIGIRHMVAKPVIHMQLEGQPIPFDLSLYKTVPFSFVNPEAYERARNELKAQVSEAVAPGYVVDNPVTRALGRAHFDQNASPALKVLSDEMASIRSRLDGIETTALIAQVTANRALGSPPDNPLTGSSSSWNSLVNQLAGNTDRVAMVRALQNISGQRDTPLALKLTPKSE
jgi:hypothetical protein